LQINKQGTEKNSQNYFCPKVARFSDMPVCLKSGITAKPLYVRIHNFGFRCVIVMCILCNFFAFLYFKITELWPFLCYFFYISLTFLCKFEERYYIQSLCCYLRRYFKHEPAWRYVQASVAAYVIDWMPYWAKLETNKNMYKTSLNKNFDTAIIQIRKK